MSAPHRNQFAAKPPGQRLAATTYVRSTRAERAAWLRAAGGRGSLSWWIRERLNAAASSLVAGCGEKCEKVRHEEGRSYLHAAQDDSPYRVDGLTYCGRCHHWIPERLNEAAQRAQDAP